MARKNRLPIIGISVGDPGGIGPEVTAKALNLQELYKLCRPLVVADASLMKEAVKIAGVSIKVIPVEDPSNCSYEYGVMNTLDMKNINIKSIQFKKVTSIQGKASFEYIQKVIELAIQRKIDATVTGPINKESLQIAGYSYPGHTEIFADLTNVKEYAMMLVDKKFRVVHVSTHTSLRKAIDRVKKARILRVIQLGNTALRNIGLDMPKIAVAGLNPHAGEKGLFGCEEIEEIIPAIEEAVKQGINVEGPIPPDTVFPKMQGGQYDLAVVMYHDQGHIPIKLIGFKYNNEAKCWDNLSGVNVTVGLPIIRTSVDHGVAFGKAGEGRANPQSMIDAIKMAVLLSRKSFYVNEKVKKDKHNPKLSKNIEK